jgi:glutaconyl-CoA decarboxylase
MSPNNPTTLTVTVNGKVYVVKLGTAAGGAQTVVVNGTPYAVTVEAPGEPPAAPPAAPPAPRPAPAALPAQPRLAALAGGQVVRAPMPGNILDVAVQAGEAVAPGQALCALEAMKMKSAIRAPRAGVVAAVHVHNGQAVTHGDPLVSFE